MPYAVELYLDREAEDTVRGLWKRLFDANVAPYLWSSGARPHVSLAVFQDADPAMLSGLTGDFAQLARPQALSLSHIGIFLEPRPVVFLAPRVTPALLELNAFFHRQASDAGAVPWESYLPDRWVPHCTVAADLDAREVHRAVQELRLGFRALTASLEEVGLVRFRPVETVAVYTLGKTVGDDGQNLVQ